MPKIMAFGNCTCEGWVNSAQDLSDRIVSSITTYEMYQGPTFEFCPFCGRKLVQAGAGHKHVGMWRGKPLFEYNHQELINIVNQAGEEMIRLRDDFTERIENMMGDQ